MKLKIDSLKNIIGDDLIGFAIHKLYINQFNLTMIIIIIIIFLLTKKGSYTIYKHLSQNESSTLRLKLLL
jgi:multisubunit Na+/H+ antiporter MnhG subunit